MKVVTPLFLIVALTINISQNLLSQNHHESVSTFASSKKINNEQQQCLSDSELKSLKKLISENIVLLKQQGNTFSSSRSRVRFSWPLRQAAGFNDPSYYYIGNYVDVNRNTGTRRDYNCGSHTYDNHRGTDITLWPFPKYKQDNNAVEVVAAAAGTIIARRDGAFDENCSFGDNLVANSISIRHSDGSIALYYHLKKWSLTNKGIGSYVQAGEYLGVVGSSGYSTDPHLHFEVWSDESGNNIIDPYSGSCNNFNSSTWWASQKPYKETKINNILTHDAVPVQPRCAFNGERQNVSNQFQAGDLVYFSLSLAHENGGTKYYRIYQPNGSLWKSWYARGEIHANSWWYNYFYLPSNAMSGNWRYTVSYKGQQVNHTFSVGNSSGGNTSSCGAVSITCGQTIISNTSTASNTYIGSHYASCLPSSYDFSAKDRLYKLNITNRRNLRIRLTDLYKDLDLFLLSSCAPFTCIASSIDGGTSSEEITLNNALGTYFISVDGYLADQVSSFRLHVDCLSSTAGEDLEISKVINSTPKIAKKQLSDFTIYPNPASDLITIDLESSIANNAIIEIYNIEGKLILNNTQSLEIGMNHFTENLSDFSSGLYLVKITNGLDTIVKKIQKL